MSNDEASAKALVEKLQEFMGRCEKLLDESIEPDLTGLDEQVEGLSNTMHELKFDELNNMQPALQGLMEQLLDLENKLKSQRDMVRESIQSVSQKKQAHTAYQTVQSSTPESDGESDS